MTGLPSVQSLESVHSFPGPYTFKVFGPGESSVLEDAHSVALSFTVAEEISLATRESSKGSYICVSITVRADTAEHVRDIYRALVKLESVRFLL